MSRILVTGGGGFTGRYLGQILADEGHEVHALVHRKGKGSIRGYVQLHEGDLCDIQVNRRIVREIQPEYVVHLAAIAFVGHSDADQIYRTNLLGSRGLLQALSELPKAPKSILLASSANIYGNASEGVLHEALQPTPINDYGVSKVAMEYVASIFREKLPLIIARPFNYTGRGQSRRFIVPKIVEHARARASIIELGNLEIARDFSDVRTVADAYARLLTAPQAIGETFNVCSGRAISLREILELVMDLSHHEFEIRVNPDFVRPEEVRSLCGSAAKLESAIGALKSIPFDETLRWMLND